MILLSYSGSIFSEKDEAMPELLPQRAMGIGAMLRWEAVVRRRAVRRMGLEVLRLVWWRDGMEETKTRENIEVSTLIFYRAICRRFW